MSAVFPQLGPKQQRGSKPRCHLLTHGSRTEVAERLTSVIAPWGQVRATDQWMPSGFERCEEAQLHSASDLLPNAADRASLMNWWLAVAKDNTSTPNIDLASTCLIQGKSGLLLIEAKAHDYELRKEEPGKLLKTSCSTNTLKNHAQIGNAIQDANAALFKDTGLKWALSRDSRYQMSNRFAWSWRVSKLGKPVILVYLGFTGCDEMHRGNSQRSISDAQDWQALVRLHSEPINAGNGLGSRVES